MSAAPSLPNLPPRAPGCGPSPARRRPPGFPIAGRGVRLGGDALPGASAVFLNSRALGEDLADVVAQCRAGRGRQTGRAVGHQRRRRLLAAAVTFSRRPQQGGRSSSPSTPAWPGLACGPRVFATNFAGHVVRADPGRRCGGRPVRRGIQRADRRKRHLRRSRRRALLTDELVGQQIPLTGPQAFTNSELVEGSAPSGVGRCATGRRRRMSSGSGSSAWASVPSSPTPIRRCSPRRWTNPPSSPTRGKDPRPARPSRSRTGCRSTATVHRADRGD